MKFVKYLILIAFAGLLIYGSLDLPDRGDPDAWLHQQESITGTEVAGNYFIRQAYIDANTPNMVTVVLGDYRSVDTLGEQVVVFAAGLICLLILRRYREI